MRLEQQDHCKCLRVLHVSTKLVPRFYIHHISPSSSVEYEQGHAQNESRDQSRGAAGAGHGSGHQMVVELNGRRKKRTPSQWATKKQQKGEGGKKKKRREGGKKKGISTRTELNHSEGPSTPHKLQMYAVNLQRSKRKA